MADQRKDNQYWKSRFKEMENDQYRKSATYYKDLQEQFRRAQNDIQMDMEHWYQRLADNNEISLAGAKRLLKGEELDEFHWTVDQYIKAGRENAVDQRWMKQLENASARSHISRLEAMKLQIQQHAEVLFTEYDSGVSEFLNKSYADQFYHTAFEIAKGTGVGSNLAAIDTRRIDTLIRQPWAQDGANFSDRIWSNKQKLVNTLHTELTQHIIRGSDPQQAIDNLARTMEVSRAQAGRLVMTESAAISSAATQDCFKELGVDQYEILAALDSRTCDICQDLDGEVFTMKEYEVGMTAPPFHPNCRCTTVPYFDDEFSSAGKRTARDPKTGKTTYVPAKMKYPEWERKYVDKSEQNGIIKSNTDRVKTKLSEQLDKLTDEEKAAITEYTGFGAQRINSALATGRNIGQVQSSIDLLDSALEKGIITDDITVARKTVPEYLNVFPAGYRPTGTDLKMLEGKILSNDIFTSTALESFNYPGRNVEIRIAVPKGYKGGLYIKDIAASKYKSQNEVLFKRGLQYRINTVRIENGVYYMEAEAVL